MGLVYGLTHQRSTLTHQRSTLTHQRSTLTHQRSTLTHQRSTLTHQRSTLTHQRSTLTHQRSTLTHQRSTLTHQRSTLTHQRSTLTHQRSTFIQSPVSNGYECLYNTRIQCEISEQVCTHSHHLSFTCTHAKTTASSSLIQPMSICGFSEWVKRSTFAQSPGNLHTISPHAVLMLKLQLAFS